jgi:hypothetical protein
MFSPLTANRKGESTRKRARWQKGGALCRSLSPNFKVPNINVLNINVIHINHEWLNFRANWHYQKLCRSTASTKIL